MCMVGDPGLSQKDLKLAMGAVMVTTMLKSWQRPGAVANATVEEFQQAKEEDDNVIIRVVNHKTGIHGSAKLVFSKLDYQCLQKYFKYIRPILVGNKLTERLFVKEGGEGIKKVQGIIESMAKQFGFKPITSTLTRKIVATNAIQKLPSQAATLVTSQMRHSVQTDARHYRAIIGRAHASDAFKHLEALRSGHPAEQTPETKRKRFTGEETELIRAAFAVNIVENTAPTLQQCKMFLGRIQSAELDGRSPKDVQDKVKNLRKKLINSITIVLYPLDTLSNCIVYCNNHSSDGISFTVYQ